ncbi:hypothetical protein WJX81_004350 [Elliptochloris bilobata]|uniref:Transaldolase n=1 Tax=Elliptochloris bilobata TaxID=381761 RepID=A0AAW1S587_9CHLO
MHGAGTIIKDVVLVGGGHAHVAVLRSFGMQPLPGVRLTLVTPSAHTAYSGMLPGYVAGWYGFDDCQLDLGRLARFARARLILAPAVGVNLQANKVLLEGRPGLGYDALSLDVGITPSGQGVPGALQHATPVKPVSTFVERFTALLARLGSLERSLTVLVVGGGAGGVELALAVRHRLETEARAAGLPAARRATVALYCKGGILASHVPAARRKFLRLLQERGVEVHESAAVASVHPGRLKLADGSARDFDECLWCTQAAAPAWLQKTGLPLDAAGFALVGPDLRSAGGPANVFAVGDVAASASDPRPKAGVFAVRQGPVLAANLRRVLRGERLRRFRPQRAYLSLISSGNRYAVATKGPFCLEGAWLWRLKDRIDRKWMAGYGADLPAMDAAPLQANKGLNAVAAAAGPAAQAALAADRMRCGGCGAKVGASVLSHALARLPPQPARPDVLAGLDARDDAAIVRGPPPGHVGVQTVDFFPAFVEDPYVFGAIAANHALGDCHAMGARARTALAVAVVPHGPEAKMEAELGQMLAGACRALGAAGCALVGGHSSEGPELALGFSVYGEAEEGALLRKGGLLPGQALVLTKALGTGVLLAADARGHAVGRHVAGALEAMQQSSEAAAACLREHGATACTDVTGFGLLGHLVEMARPSRVRARLDLSAVPLLPGAQTLAAAGTASSLAPANARAAAAVTNAAAAVRHPAWALTLDPQTAGGLLAGVPANRAEACVARLRALGYVSAAVIGEVVAETVGSPGGPVSIFYDLYGKPDQPGLDDRAAGTPTNGPFGRLSANANSAGDCGGLLTVGSLPGAPSSRNGLARPETQTQFYQPVVAHLAGLRDREGRPLVTCCTFDNRGIGLSSIPTEGSAYSTRLMAYDVLGLLDHLQWRRAHLVGLSLGGFVACKAAALAPLRVASLTLLATTRHGWHTAASLACTPWLAAKAGVFPMSQRKIAAYLRVNFSPAFLAQRVDGRPRRDALIEGTWDALRLSLTEKFLAEDQPAAGSNGHVRAALSHRLNKEEIGVIRRARIPVQCISGRSDLCAGKFWVSRFARALGCRHILLEGGHAGICLESCKPICDAIEEIMQVAVLREQAALEKAPFLRLFLDSASPVQWDRWSRYQLFYGFTTNPIILSRDQVPECSIRCLGVLAKQAWDLGAQELQLQAWGDTAGRLFSVGLDLAAIDAARIVVKLPITAEGVEAAAYLKDRNVRVTLTGVYAAHQCVTALAVGADYLAPYLGRMNEAGRDGQAEIVRMQKTVTGLGSQMRVLVASVRQPADMAALAAQGCDTFTLSPDCARELFQEPLTLQAAADFQEAARTLGGM